MENWTPEVVSKLVSRTMENVGTQWDNGKLDTGSGVKTGIQDILAKTSGTPKG